MESLAKQLIEQNILAEEEQLNKEIYRSHWRGSNMGRCYRFQVLYRNGHPPTNTISLEVKKIFRVGDLFHQDIQSLLPANTVEVDVLSDDFCGHADHVGEDYIEDFKTIGDYQWKLLNKKGFNVVNDKLPYIYQVMAYAVMLDKPKGILTFIHKDNYEMKSFEFTTAKWKEKILEELVKLNEFWEVFKNVSLLPPAMPRCYNFKECSYCLWQTYCDNREGNTAKDRAGLAAQGNKAF